MRREPRTRGERGEIGAAADVQLDQVFLLGRRGPAAPKLRIANEMPALGCRNAHPKPVSIAAVGRQDTSRGELKLEDAYASNL